MRVGIRDDLKKVRKATTLGNPMIFFPLPSCHVQRSPFTGGHQPARVQEAPGDVYSTSNPYIPLVSPALDCFSSQPRFMLRLGPTFSHAVYGTALD